MSHAFGPLLIANGFFLRREAVAGGHTDRQLYAAVASKEIQRIRHGAYSDWRCWASYDDRRRHLLLGAAVIRQASSSVVLSHLSAVAALGGPLWDIHLDDVHVTRLDGRSGRREAGVAQHRGRLAPADIITRGGVQMTGPARTAVDLTTLLDLEHALPILDWLLAQRLTDRAAMRRQAERQHLEAGTLGTLLAISLADGSSESVAESRLRYLCWRYGLPMPRANVKVRDSRGRVVARVDLAWPKLGVFVEFDGKQKYDEYRRPGEDVTEVLLRQNERERLVVELTGWRCMRLRWRHLSRPDRLAAWLDSVLGGAPTYDNPLRF